MAIYRFIASTGKHHEHRVIVAADLDVATLPVWDGGATLAGWYQCDGIPCWIGACAECAKPLNLVGSYVSGKYSPARKCDSRCTSAHGSYCACECRGTNHGIDWMQKTPAWQPPILREASLT